MVRVIVFGEKCRAIANKAVRLIGFVPIVPVFDSRLIIHHLKQNICKKEMFILDLVTILTLQPWSYRIEVADLHSVRITFNSFIRLQKAFRRNIAKAVKCIGCIRAELLLRLSACPMSNKFPIFHNYLNV